MASKVKAPRVKAGRPNTVVLTGTITIGSSGAIASQSSECGTAEQTADEAGRYTVTLDRPYKDIRPLGNPGFVGPDDDAFPDDEGVLTAYRNFDVTGLTQTFDIQCVRSDTLADADPASGSVLTWAVEAREF